VTILGTCPECGGTAPLDAYLSDAQARRALAAALKCPESLAAQIPPYLTLFAPGAKRLQMRRLAALLDELAALIASGEVTRNRDTRAAPLALWAEGLAAVLASRDAGTLDLPLAGHGLLCEIVHRRAGRSGRTDAPLPQSAGSADPAHRPGHPSHRPFTQPDGPQGRREEVADLVGERARFALLLRVDPADQDAAGQLADIDARLRAYGIDPGAKQPRRPKPQGLTALSDLIGRAPAQE